MLTSGEPIIHGDQNCSTCGKTWPSCGRKKRAIVVFCREPWVTINDRKEMLKK